MAGTLHTGDIRLSDGRTLRVGVEPDGGVILAIGTGTGREWREDPDAGLSLPPGTFTALTSALRRLGAAPASE